MKRLAVRTIITSLTALLCVATLRPAEAGVPDRDVQRITDAVPSKATVQPKRPRKLLVFNLCKGFRHKSIPWGAKAFEIMGRKTGAYETVASSDISVFEPGSLRQFDAVCFNNTTRELFTEERLKESLLDFVRGGKGIVGVHAATDCFYKWPEFGEMMGGYFDGHPWHEKVGIKLDEPGHPLCAVFEGKGFEIKDEIYQIKAPYSRDKLRVLLSLDTDKTNMKKKGIKRTDNDFAVSWIRSYGKGRVFYCSLGHRNEIFWNPLVLRYYLDGIQFAMGDLEADAISSTAARNRPREVSRERTKPPTPPKTPALSAREEGQKKAERLFKMARQAEKMGQRGAAASLYSKIVKDYAGTSFAGRAQERLERLGR